MTESEPNVCCCGPNCAGPVGRFASAHGEITSMLVWQAERAKMELLREKIKKHLDARRGKVYDRIAEALAEHAQKLAERSAEGDAAYEQLDERVRKILKGA